MIYVFGDCTLDTDSHELPRAGQGVALEPKVFQVLLYLLQHRDRIVTKDSHSRSSPCSLYPRSHGNALWTVYISIWGICRLYGGPNGPDSPWRSTVARALDRRSPCR